MAGKEIRAVLGRNLKLYRGIRAMSQAALAEKAKISIPFLSDIERGNKWPYMDTLINLAEALDIEAYELLKPPEAGSEEMDRTIGKCLDTVSSALHQSIDLAITQTLERIRKGYQREPPSSRTTPSL